MSRPIGVWIEVPQTGGATTSHRSRRRLVRVTVAASPEPDGVRAEAARPASGSVVRPRLGQSAEQRDQALAVAAP